jgi:hypothetical protein
VLAKNQVAVTQVCIRLSIVCSAPGRQTGRRSGAGLPPPLGGHDVAASSQIGWVRSVLDEDGSETRIVDYVPDDSDNEEVMRLRSGDT